jgi:hypothetical protein
VRYELRLRVKIQRFVIWLAIGAATDASDTGIFLWHVPNIALAGVLQSSVRRI